MKEICEIIFQKHKENGGHISLDKETYKPNLPAFLNEATERMVHEKILIRLDRFKTMINPDCEGANSYESAKQKINEIKNQQLTPSIKVEGGMIGSINTGNNVNQSLNDLHYPRIDNTSNSNPKTPKKKSVLEIMAWIIGIIAGLLAIYEFILKHVFKTPSLF